MKNVTDDLLFSSVESDPYFSLLRTNVRLTGNIKHVIIDENKCCIESISSNSYLSNDTFKGIAVNLDRSYQQNVYEFCRKISTYSKWYDTSNKDSKNRPNILESQYATQYTHGAYTESESQIKGRYRFFAPLWINTKFPDCFAIFKVPNTEFSTLSDYIKGAQLVKIHDFRNTKVQKYFNQYINSSNFNIPPIKFSFNGETNFFGLDIQKGELTSKKENRILGYLANERTITEFNNEITNGFYRNNLVLSKLLNLEFVFDDVFNDNGFNNYVGIYFDATTLTFDEAQLLQQKSSNINRSLLLFNRTDTVIQRLNFQSLLKDYYSVSATNTIVSTNSSYPQLIAFYLKAAPELNTQLIIKYNGLVELEIQLGAELYNNNLGTMTKNISDKINEMSTEAKNLALKSYIYQDKTLNRPYIIIQSIQNSQVLENIELIVPINIEVLNPEYKNDPEIKKNNFVGINKNDIIVSSYIDVKGVDKILINEKLHDIIFYYNYLGYKILRLANFSAANSIGVKTMKLVNFKQAEIFLAKLAKTKDFDYNQIDTTYNDIVDFNLSDFRNWMHEIINSNDFVGSWNETMPMTLAEYKEQLLEYSRNYFNSINNEGKFLINKLNPTTFESESTVVNEFDRLGEIYLLEFESNKQDPFISKWGSSYGTNTYNTPYGLNIALPFKTDNFAPNIYSSNRSLNLHTHSWPIIAEGYPKYAKKLHILGGYSSQRITIADLKNVNVDAYEKLSHKITHNDESFYEKPFWSNMRVSDRVMGKSDVFFRGVHLEFDGLYQDYRFSVILSTTTNKTPDKVQDIFEIVDNQKFRTLTLVIKFNIPDPFLTSLERGDSEYFVDRSLLYYISTVFQTKGNANIFGTGTISLSLFDTTSGKIINGVSTNNLWYTTYQGEPAYWIGRGDINKFQTKFSDIIEVGTNFSWRYSTFDINNNEIVQIIFTAKDICFVGDDYFWCRDIEMKMYDGRIRSLVDDLENSDPIFLTTRDNEWFMSNSISYYNAVYDLVMAASANVSRYNSISSGALFNTLNKYPIENIFVSYNGSITSSQKFIRVLPPTSTMIVNSLSFEKGEMIQLPQPIVYNINRHSYWYSPIFKDIHIPHSNEDFKNAFFGTTFRSNGWIKGVGEINVEDENPAMIIGDFSNLENIYSSKLYWWSVGEYNHTNITTLTHYKEQKLGLISSILYLDPKIDIISKVDLNGKIDLLIPSYEKLYNAIFYIPFTDIIKKEILSTTYIINDINFKDFSAEQLAFYNFFAYTFLRFYRIDNVLYKSDNSPISYKVDGVINLKLDDNIRTDDEVIIKFVLS